MTKQANGSLLITEIVNDQLIKGNLGTTWVEPKKGATWTELGNAIPLYRPAEIRGDIFMEAVKKVEVNELHRGKFKTNLALTGKPLQEYDLKRILAL